MTTLSTNPGAHAGLDPQASKLKPLLDGALEKCSDGFYRTTLSLEKDTGECIRGLLTTPGNSWKGLVVVLAGLGRTMRHTNATALAAAHHGYATLRFDPTHHTGDSDGGILDSLMTRITEDLVYVCKSARASWEGPLFAAVASTFARCAISSAQELGVDGMILNLPVVHFEKTLATATEEPLFENYRQGKYADDTVLPILTHEIYAAFLGDSDAAGYCDLETSRRELLAAPMPIAMIVAEGDAWVELDDVVYALEPDGARRKLYVLENADHDSYSFGFIRAITQSMMQALGEMSGHELGDLYEVSFSKYSAAVKTDKKILQRGRALWSQERAAS